MDQVFFDSNAGNPESGYLLDFDKSKEDLSRIGGRIKDGLLVTLYMPGELQVTAQLQFDPDNECWVGIPTKPWDFRDIEVKGLR